MDSSNRRSYTPHTVRPAITSLLTGAIQQLTYMLSNASSHCTSRQRTHAKTVLHCPVHMHVTGEIALTPKQAAQASAPSKRPTVSQAVSTDATNIQNIP